MALKHNKRRSYAKPTVTRYHHSGFNIDLVPANKDNQKWKVYREDNVLGHVATVGAAVRAIKKFRGGV